MSELAAFERELAELEKITGIHIAEDRQAETYSIFVKTQWATVRRTWFKPEPFKLGWIDWCYLYSLAIWDLWRLWLWYEGLN